MKFIPGGDFGIQVHDNITGITKTKFLYDLTDFYLSKTEVSVQDYLQFTKETGRSMPPAPDWGWGDPKLPMVNVTYQDALDYCVWLSNKTGILFRLPQKDEWEYAARSGDFDPIEDNLNIPKNEVVYIANSYEKPECITCMQPNKLGLYATIGNVWEWVEKPVYIKQHDSILNESYTIYKPEIYWAGGSFFEEASKVQPDSFMPIPPNTRRQDVGFRVVANTEDFKKGILIQKIQQLLFQIFEDDKITVNQEGIFLNGEDFLWQNIPFDTALSYDVETSTVFLCCVLAQNADDIKITQYLSVGYEIPKNKADFVFDLMHLLNVDPDNLNLLKK